MPLVGRGLVRGFLWLETGTVRKLVRSASLGQKFLKRPRPRDAAPGAT